MEMDEAIAAATPAKVVDMDELSSTVIMAQGGNTQREGHARVALAQLREALASLASLGHSLVISHAPEAQKLRFPQTVHRSASGEEMTVENETEFDQALADGWTEFPGQSPTTTQVRSNEGENH